MKPGNDKTDPKLGLKVHEALSREGLETPMVHLDKRMGAPEQQDAIQGAMKQMMHALNLDLNDPSLVDTPGRVSKMFLNEFFYGLDYHYFPRCTTVPNTMCDDSTGFVIEPGISVKSTCEHHFVVIEGVASVAYIPDKVILGLSKLNRIVDFFSRRPQVQERLTSQIACTLQTVLDTSDVAVIIEAVHYCVRHRGVEDQHSYTRTASLHGAFRLGPLRQEFLQCAQTGRFQ